MCRVIMVQYVICMKVTPVVGIYFKAMLKVVSYFYSFEYIVKNQCCVQINLNLIAYFVTITKYINDEILPS